MKGHKLMPRLKILNLFLICVTAISAFPVISRANASGDAGDDSGIRIVEATTDKIVLRLSANTYRLSAGEQGDTQITVPGAESLAEAGAPTLPVLPVILGVPAGAAYTVTYRSLQTAQLLPGSFTILAAPSPVQQQEDFKPGQQQNIPAVSIYHSDSFYPDRVVRAGQDAWLRDQRILRLEYFPFQYNPVSGQLTWLPEVEVEVALHGSALSSDWAASAPDQDPAMESVLQRTLVNYQQARAWRAFPAEPTQLDDYPVGAAGQPALKITVDQDGLYVVSYEDMLAVKFAPAANPALFSLTSQGRPVAYEVLGDGDALFETGEALRFYGEKFTGDYLATVYNNQRGDWLKLCPLCRLKGMFEKYTYENVYWLTVEETEGAQMKALNAAPDDTAPVPDVYIHTVHAERNTYWYSHHFTNEDTWFGGRFQNVIKTVTQTFTTTLSGLPTGVFTATLKASVVARTSLNNHRVNYYFNTGLTPVATSTWSGVNRATASGLIPSSMLQAGSNDLKVRLEKNTSAEDVYFDWFEISYPRKFLAEEDALMFNAASAGLSQYEVSNLTSASVVAYDITDPLKPVRLLNPRVEANAGMYKAVFQAENAGQARFFVAGQAAQRSPRRMALYSPANLVPPGGGADYIVIAHADFLQAIQPLVEYRRSQGLNVFVVDVAELYDQFNFGIFHPIAIRNYLSQAMVNWAVKPGYVLLVGGGNFNILNYLSKDYPLETNYIPPALAVIDPWQGETDASSLLAMVLGNDWLPDLSLGRFPAQSVSEVTTMVNKTIQYEQALIEPWQKEFVFVSDNADSAGNFESSSNEAAQYLDGSGLTARKIYLSEFGCSVKGSAQCKNLTGELITNTLNTRGALLVNYVGHGSRDRWTHERIFANEHISKLTNAGQLAVTLSWTCLDGFWQYPASPSLTEAALVSGKGGVAAALSPSGLGISTGHDYLAKGFFDTLVQDGVWEIGRAQLNAKLALYKTTANSYADLLFTYAILGDPALRLRSPYQLQLTPTDSSGTGLPGSMVSYSIEIMNSGLMTDTAKLAFTEASWAVTLPAQVGPLAPGQRAVVSVQVQIPPGAPTGAMDRGQLAAHFSKDKTHLATSWLQTLVAANLYLPLVRR